MFLNDALDSSALFFELFFEASKSTFYLLDFDLLSAAGFLF